MSSIDRQRRDAVTLLEEIGYRWTGTEWTLPHAEELPIERQLSLVDIGDMMCHQLIAMMPDDPDDDTAVRLQWLHEAWDGASGFEGRHLPKTPADSQSDD